MTGESLDNLLQKLTVGDTDAAEQVFLAYEPYLRMVVRRKLTAGMRAKFDSMDIVQSVWADLLDGFRQARWKFQDVDHLRAFLVKVTHHRFVDRVRQHAPALDHEQPITPSGLETMASPGEARPSQLAQADELWERLMATASPAHRQILDLKRQGFSLDEIAARTQLHKSSVRRILYQAARGPTMKS